MDELDLAEVLDRLARRGRAGAESTPPETLHASAVSRAKPRAAPVASWAPSAVAPLSSRWTRMTLGPRARRDRRSAASHDPWWTNSFRSRRGARPQA